MPWAARWPAPLARPTPRAHGASRCVEPSPIGHNYNASYRPSAMASCLRGHQRRRRSVHGGRPPSRYGFSRHRDASVDRTRGLARDKVFRGSLAQTSPPSSGLQAKRGRSHVLQGRCSGAGAPRDQSDFANASSHPGATSRCFPIDSSVRFASSIGAGSGSQRRSRPRVTSRTKPARAGPEDARSRPDD